MGKFIFICAVVFSCYVWRMDSFSTGFWTLMLIGLASLALEILFGFFRMLDDLFAIARQGIQERRYGYDYDDAMYPQEHRDPTRPRYVEHPDVEGSWESASVWNTQQRRK